MKKVLLVLALFASNVASAAIQPEDIFGGILDLIQDQINKDKNPGWDEDYGSGVILKDLDNDRIALGRIRLDEDNSTGSFVLPKCNTSPNAFVSALRFRITGADAYVRRVRIAYQNGDMENVSVDETYESGTASDWYQVDTGKRCVKSITVRGEPVHDGFGFDNDNGFGLDGITGFGHKPGHLDWDKPPGVIIKKDATVLTFIGLKTDSSGF
jgi:hypothetical protein